MGAQPCAPTICRRNPSNPIRWFRAAVGDLHLSAGGGGIQGCGEDDLAEVSPSVDGPSAYRRNGADEIIMNSGCFNFYNREGSGTALSLFVVAFGPIMNYIVTISKLSGGS